MLLTIRVILTILFSAFVLWSQTPDDDRGWLSAAAKEQLKIPSLVAFSRGSGRQMPDQLRLNVNLPQIAPAAGNPAFTGKLVLSLGNQNPSTQLPPPRPKAVSYSSGYSMRAKIHKYASIATLPLFVSEAIVGQKLMNRTNGEDSLRSVHSALAAGTGVLFGVNSVTGVWNMWETRKDPGHRKRMFHGILMLAADAGFVATAALAPHREDGGAGVRRISDASTHRAVAFASFGIASVSYVYMLIAR